MGNAFEDFEYRLMADSDLIIDAASKFCTNPKNYGDIAFCGTLYFEANPTTNKIEKSVGLISVREYLNIYPETNPDDAERMINNFQATKETAVLLNLVNLTTLSNMKNYVDSTKDFRQLGILDEKLKRRLFKSNYLENYEFTWTNHEFLGTESKTKFVATRSFLFNEAEEKEIANFNLKVQEANLQSSYDLLIQDGKPFNTQYHVDLLNDPLSDEITKVFDFNDSVNLIMINNNPDYLSDDEISEKIENFKMGLSNIEDEAKAEQLLEKVFYNAQARREFKDLELSAKNELMSREELVDLNAILDKLYEDNDA